MENGSLSALVMILHVRVNVCQGLGQSMYTDRNIPFSASLVSRVPPSSSSGPGCSRLLLLNSLAREAQAF